RLVPPQLRENRLVAGRQLAEAVWRARRLRVARRRLGRRRLGRLKGADLRLGEPPEVTDAQAAQLARLAEPADGARVALPALGKLRGCQPAGLVHLRRAR